MKKMYYVFVLCLVFSSMITTVQAGDKRLWDLERTKDDTIAPVIYTNVTFFYEDENDGNKVKEKALNFVKGHDISRRKDTSIVQILQDEDLGEVTSVITLSHVGFVEGDVKLVHDLNLDGTDGETYSFYRLEYTTNLNQSTLDWIVEEQGLTSAALVHNYTIEVIAMRWMYQYEDAGNIDYFVDRPEIRSMKLQLGSNLYDIPLISNGKPEYSEFNIKTYVVPDNISTTKPIIIYTGNEYYRISFYLTFSVFMFISFVILISVIEVKRKINKKRGRISK